MRIGRSPNLYCRWLFELRHGALIATCAVALLGTARPIGSPQGLSAYRNLVFKLWATNARGVSGDMANYLVPPVKGDYSVTVAYGGQPYVIPRDSK